jgi:hypothetical protein
VVSAISNTAMAKMPAYRTVRSKYNYILAAALDTGTAICGIIMFFAISYPGYSFPEWWGNTVFANTADGLGLAWKPMPDSGVFGPANGTWS